MVEEALHLTEKEKALAQPKTEKKRLCIPCSEADDTPTKTHRENYESA